MNTSWRVGYWKLGLVSFVAMGYAIAFNGDCALAQITPDGTLGAESSVVTPTAPGSPVDVIDGGATRGANLFHSFEQFSVPTGGEASFNNALDIQNIISRVTGASISNIDGLLRANGTANLFLLNPNGIIFGPNASLNIGGSFLGSTASSLNFADGSQFSATAPQATPLLTVSVPLGLQYGGAAGSILNQSQATNSSGGLVGLQVQPGNTLMLMGGDVRLDGGILFAPGGRVELGGVSGAGTVGLNVDGSNLSLSYPASVQRADVSLTNGARVYVAASGGGSIAVNARNLDVLGGTELTAGIRSGQGSVGRQAGDIEIDATGAVTVAGSNIFNTVRPEAVGNGGDINITTGSLSLTDGAQVSASISGRGDAGDLIVRAADSVEMSGDGSTLSARVNPGSQGAGGNLTVEAGRLSVSDGAQVSASTFGAGNAGDLIVRASDSVEMSGDGSALSAQVNPGSQGAGGNLTVEAGRLSVSDGAQVSASTFGAGNAGDLIVRAADSVEVSGDGNTNTAGLFAQVQEGAQGDGGNLTVESGQLTVKGDNAAISTSTLGSGSAGNLTIGTGRFRISDGARVLALTSGTGDAGDLIVRASDSVEMSGDGSALSAQVNPGAQGGGGNLTVEAGRLSVSDGAFVAASTFGAGNAGTLIVRAADSVEVSGSIPTGLFARVESEATGGGGDLTIETGRLSVSDGAEVDVSSEGSGNAGALRVEASSIELENQGKLRASTASGEGGNIDLQVQDLILMRRNSLISAQARGTATGGNITIKAPLLVAVPSENSDIIANASQGRGGMSTATQNLTNLLKLAHNRS